MTSFCIIISGPHQVQEDGDRVEVEGVHLFLLVPSYGGLRSRHGRRHQELAIPGQVQLPGNIKTGTEKEKIRVIWYLHLARKKWVG